MNIEYLLDDLRHQVIESESFLNPTHDRLLAHLPATEKQQLRELFCKWEWNIGSVKVLRRLQEARIVTATEYIASVNGRSSDEAALILNDILEAETPLLASLFTNLGSVNSSSLQIVDLLRDCIRGTCVDFCENPNVISVDYIKEIRALLPRDCFNGVSAMHVSVFLKESSKCTIGEAFKCQKRWRDEAEQSRSSTLTQIISSLAQTAESRDEFLRRIIKIASSEQFQCWKWYLLFLRCAVCESEDFDFYVADELKATARNLSKELFKECVQENSARKFRFLLLTARTICKSNERILGSYAAWYKATVGDMKYALKNEEFDLVMSMLVDLIFLEEDVEVLEIHAKTHIAVPPLRNDQILHYKQLCSSKVSNLQKGASNSINQDSDVILIE